MRLLKKYLLIYKTFVENSFSEAMTYRFHFVLMLFMDLMFYGSSLATIDFIFDHLQVIGHWQKEQFLFFISFMLAVDHLHMTFISENFWEFSEDVRTGKLDFALLKPAGTVFITFFRFVRPATLLNGFVPWGLMIFYGSQIKLGFWQWLFIPLGILLALLLLVALELLIMMSVFWTIESFGVNFLRMQLQQVSRMPDFVYTYFARKFFTIVFPVLLIGSAPVRFILDHEWYSLAGMLAAIVIVAYFVRIVWRIGLKRYESASS